MAGGDKEDRLLPGSIVRRNLHPTTQGDTQEAVSQALLRLRTVRLDREGIKTLRNLEMVKEAHSLYLQKNQIKKIENLDVLKNLRFLSLSGNRIEDIQNLQCLQHLQLLDLSYNLIQRLDTGQLPQTLLTLDLTGNPCTKTQDYRQQILGALPFLQELDGEAVRGSPNQGSLSDNEDEDCSDSDDTSLPFDDSGLSSLGQEMLQRSYQRRSRALREHEERLAELSDTTDAQPLTPSGKDSCNAEHPPSSIISAGCENPQHSTSWKSKPHNSIISRKDPQTPAVTEKHPLKQQNTSKPATKNQIATSPTQSGAGRSRLGLLNRTSSRKLPSSDPQPKFQQTAGKIRGTAPAAQNERQAISAPTTRKLPPIPTKKNLQPPATHGTASTSSRAQSVSALSSRKLQTVPTKKTLQQPEKPPVTILKVNSSAQGSKK